MFLFQQCLSLFFGNCRLHAVLIDDDVGTGAITNNSLLFLSSLQMKPTKFVRTVSLPSSDAHHHLLVARAI